ncbi:class I SAM-dependent methyltransferase [Phycicoccus flavus]|uniref:class I SAM-dependent methyltransferase n=1 Tax=Phycicoccus flavus TaxID=2502783 RepID=UPI000FEBFA0B|nr:methyltransferase domain-containing protein [Phycicoccus flavus]NHA67513.1 methyltransferase domain-containing protein [Phycicoccus flavus]
MEPAARPDQTDDDQPAPAPEELERGAALRWYIDKYETPYGRSTVPFADALRHVMPPATRLRAKVLATDALARREGRKARALAEAASPVRLHLGCGWTRIEGWINSDLVGAAGDFDWNILRPLPFEDGSVDAVFYEHVFEHLRYSQTLTVLGHARRALRPGGVLRVGVPDAGMYARSYADDPEALAAGRWGRPTGMLVLREVFQEHAHVSAYDAETLRLVLQEGGFPGAEVTPGGSSPLLGRAPDSPDRIPETVYAEVRRPSD